MQINIRRNSNRKYCSKCDRYGNHTDSLCNEAIENICFYCGQKHTDKICSLIICPVCAGNHPESRCIINRKELKCSICNTLGHINELCPNNWRIFHSVTSLDNIDKVGCPIYKENVTCPGCGISDHLYYKCPNLRKELMNYNPIIDKSHINAIKQRYIDSIKTDNSLNSNPDQPCCSKQLNNDVNKTVNGTETNSEINEIESTSSSDYKYDVDMPVFKSINYNNKQNNNFIKDNQIKLDNKRTISSINDNESMNNSTIDDDNSTINDIIPFNMNSSNNKSCQISKKFKNKNTKKFKHNSNKSNNSHNKFNNSHNKFNNSNNKLFNSKSQHNYPNLNNSSNSINRSNNLDYFKKRNKYKKNQNKFNSKGSNFSRMRKK